MENYRIIGIDHKDGEYQNRHYSNFYIYAANGKASVCGETVEKFKIKEDDFMKMKGGFNPQDLLNKVFVPYFDKYGNLIDIKWIK